MDLSPYISWLMANAPQPKLLAQLTQKLHGKSSRYEIIKKNALLILEVMKNNNL